MEIASAEPVVSKKTYAGIFLLSLTTLMYEILLTRIFSVTLWYHFAFMAVSMALFGMAGGALLVFFRPKYFSGERVKNAMAVSALFFALAIVLTFFIHINTPFYEKNIRLNSLPLTFTYIAMAVPFFLSGIGTCLALTKFSKDSISRLYAADLAGGATGCLALFLIFYFASGQAAVFTAAFFASLSGLFFALDSGRKNIIKISQAATLALFLSVAINIFYEQNGLPLLRLRWVKGGVEQNLLYEKWNSYSRVSVTSDQNWRHRPFGWGLSDSGSSAKIDQLALTIDGNAMTVLTKYPKNFSDLDYLKSDVTNVAHYLRPNSDVLVIGAGGGRDVLSSLAFGQKSVVAVEMNSNIVSTVNGKFGDFTGHLDKDPRVAFVVDEGRSYVARQKRKFDIIEASLIDTWAATAAGAYVLSENSLYTVEAWNVFLKHLNPGGVLSFSRWYHRDLPAEIYRVVSLAAESLKESGVASPRDHIAVFRYMNQSASSNLPDGVGTVLVSMEPFSEADSQTMRRIAREKKFEVVLAPNASSDPVLETISSGSEAQALIASLPIDISPPTDDNPFFFQMTKFKDIILGDTANQGLNNLNTVATSVLFFLVAVVFTLLALCILIPTVGAGSGFPIKDAIHLIVFFCAIGFGYILIEVSQMQRLAVFLGHPAYSLSVVLSTLLVSSGIGSWSVSRLKEMGIKKGAIFIICILLFTLAVFGIITPTIIFLSQSFTNMLRIAIAVAIIAPAGFFMGMIFPIGMRLSFDDFRHLAPWFWGINGAASVCASVLAVAIALVSGISAAYWTGAGFYLLALLCLLFFTPRERKV